MEANGKSKPVAQFQIALMSNGQVVVGMEGQVNRQIVCQVLANALIEFNRKLEEAQGKGALVIPPPVILRN